MAKKSDVKVESKDEEFEEADLADEEFDEEFVEDEEIDEELDGDALVVVDDAAVPVVEPDAEEKAAPAAKRPARKKGEEDEEDEDELDPDDVEADLDTILKDRIAATDDEDEDEEEADGQGGTGTRVQPKKASEFVCKSCFLVKSVSQRVDGTDDLCNDCV
jgi:hypothetical protein